MNLTLATYSLLAGLTPVLVLANSFVIATAPRSVQPWQSMSLGETAMALNLETLAVTAGQRPELSASHEQASVINRDGQLFLEFHYGLNAIAQTPNLMLVLCDQAAPDGQFEVNRDCVLVLGRLQPTAGRQQYLIPAAIAIDQYRSVVIWSPELDAVMGYIPLAL